MASKSLPRRQNDLSLSDVSKMLATLGAAIGDGNGDEEVPDGAN